MSRIILGVLLGPLMLIPISVKWNFRLRIAIPD